MSSTDSNVVSKKFVCIACFSCLTLYVMDCSVGLQERPPKPDVAWLADTVWNTACDLDDCIPAFKGFMKEIVAAPIFCTMGRMEVSVCPET